MREKGLKEKEREAPTHLIELARFTHASRVTKDSYTIMHYVSTHSYMCTYELMSGTGKKHKRKGKARAKGPFTVKHRREMLLTLEAKDYGDVLDCAIRDQPGSWPTPEAVQDEENLCGRNLPRPS